MGFFDKIKNILPFPSVSRPEIRETAPAQKPPAQSATGWEGDISAFLSQTGAMSVATAYRCVKLISDSVAQLPLLYMAKREGTYFEKEGDRLNYLLQVEPNEGISAYDMKSEMVAQMLIQGSAYMVPVYNRKSMDVERLVLCARNSVQFDTQSGLYYVEDRAQGVSGVYRPGEIIHVKHMCSPADMRMGVGPLSNAGNVLGIAEAAGTEALSRLRNGGVVRGIVSNDRTVKGFGKNQDEQLDFVAADIEEQLRQRRIVYLPGTVNLHQLQQSAADMQFMEMVKFYSVREVCRIFGVPPSFVFDDSSSNYKSAEMASAAFLTNTVNPVLVKIENELGRKLIAPGWHRKYKFQFDRRGMYASDLESKAKYYTTMIGAGIFTPNEARRMENQAPVAGGDKALVSANLKSLDELTSQQPQQTQNQEDDGEE